MPGTTSIRIRPTYARRMPDPKLTKGERHLFLVAAKDVPEGIPNEPNARRPLLNKRVYQNVMQSLMSLDGSEPGTFHLKNKGVTVIADDVQKIGDDFVIKFKKGQGAVDGGHTLEIINKAKESGKADIPEDQFVSIEVRTGVPEEWVPEISRGLNTSVQVQEMSLEQLKGHFDWMKDALKGEPYYKEIAWSENDDGDYDARDVVSLLYLFNVKLFPNKGDDHPIAGYEKKSTALKAFQADGDQFQSMRRLLKDVLTLHDTIAMQARDVWNESTPGGKGGNLSFIETRKSGDFDFHFVGQKGPYRLMGGALYPILAAFRWYVEKDKSGNLRWRDGFGKVLEAWDEDGAELLNRTKYASDDHGRNPNAIGKSRTHWANLYTVVAMKDLMRRQAAE